MCKILSALLSIPFFTQALLAQTHAGNEELYVDKTSYNIYGLKQIEMIREWGAGSSWGELFTLLQANYFSSIFLAILVGVPLAFLVHYAIIGQRKFSHANSIQVFSRYNIIVHWLCAIPFMLICLTGLMMMFGDNLGGGSLVRLARDVHGIATCVFVPCALLMFCMWVKDAMPKMYDVQWLRIGGGYLSKENSLIPAGKFNAGQKAWFWVATLGGLCMAFSGGFLFFQSASLDTLRMLAILHNLIGFVVIGLLITHIYMAVFAIEGALSAMLDGKMAEEEIAILHSYYYEEIKRLEKA